MGRLSHKKKKLTSTASTTHRTTRSGNASRTFPAVDGVSAIKKGRDGLRDRHIQVLIPATDSDTNESNGQSSGVPDVTTRRSNRKIPNLNSSTASKQPGISTTKRKAVSNVTKTNVKTTTSTNGVQPARQRNKVVSKKTLEIVTSKSKSRKASDSKQKKRLNAALTTLATVSVAKGKKRKTEPDAASELTANAVSPSKAKRPKRGQLVPNLNVTEYLIDPTFERPSPIPFISPLFQSKLLIRAVLLNNVKLLKQLTQETKSITSYCVPRCLQINRDALSYAIEKGNIAAMKILLPNPVPENLATSTPWLIEEEETGRGSRYQFGHALRNVTVGRGGKEGNVALLKDRHMVDAVVEAYDCFTRAHWIEALRFGLPLSTLEKMKSLVKNHDFSYEILSNIVSAVQNGHNMLAAQLIDQALTKGGFGFNNLHMEALQKTKRNPLTPFKFQSVGKKTIMNNRITPLHCAAINPDPYCLSAMLNVAPLYTVLDDRNWTLVHYAAACTGTAPLEVLINRGISTNQVNKEGETPAHIAAELGRAKHLELILKAEAEAPSNQINDDEDEEDDDARPKGKKKVAADAFSALRISKKGFTPLQAACAAGQVESVKVLLESPLVDKDKPTGAQFDKLTPLMIAAGHGHLEVVKYLIGVGAKLQLKDRRGKIALAHAVINGHAHIVSYLLRLGDNHLAKDTSGNTLVHFACAYAWNFNLKLLLEAGCCPNEPNLWKLTPLAIAFCKGHIGIVEILLKEPGVNINAPIDSKGLTLLLQTVSAKPSAEMILRLKYLIEEQNADCTVTDFEKNTAIHYLVLSEHKQQKKIQKQKARGWGDEEEIPKEDYVQQALDFLVKNGLSLDNQNSSQETPISNAANLGCFKLVQKLVEMGGTLSPQPNALGDTILHLLVDHLIDEELNVAEFYNNCAQDVKALAAMKVMSQVVNEAGMTPLHRTLNQHSKLNVESAKKVLDYIFFLVIRLDSDVNAVVKGDTKVEAHGNSVLHLVTNVNYAEDALKIIMTKKPFLDPVNATGKTPLATSILKQAQTATKILVENGANVNFVSTKNGGKSMILLEVSQPKSAFSLVPLFISKGANVKEIVDGKTGNSLLHFVAKNPTGAGAIEAIKSLLAAGVMVDCENKYLRTSLHLAITTRGGETDSSYDVEDALLEGGANLSVRDMSGRIPLHYAFLKIGKGKKDTATSFLDPIELVTLITSAMKETNCSGDIETTDKNGLTPLHAAAIRGATISASHLLGESSNPMQLLNRADNQGNTPLAYAVLSNHEGCALMLLQAGSDFVMELNSGSTKLLGEDSGAWVWNPVFAEISLLDSEKLRNAKHSILEEIVRKDWQGLLYLMIQKLTATGSGVIPGIEAALRTRRFKLANKLISRVKASAQLTAQKPSLLHLLAQNASAQCDSDIQSKVLDTLVRNNVDLKGLDFHQSTPVVYAAINWNIHLCLEFTRLMTLGEVAKIKPDSAGRTPFSALFWNTIAAETEFPVELRTWAESLIENGGKGDVRCRYPIETSSYPGIRYVRKDGSTVPITLETQGSKVRPWMIPEYSPLILAVIYGNKKVVKWLLSLQGKIDINFPDSVGRTPMMHAVRLNDIRMVKLLLNPTTYDFEKDINPWCEIEKGRKTGDSTRGSPTSGIDLKAIDNEGYSIIHHLVSPICTSSSLVYARAEAILKVLAGAKAPLNMKSPRLDETPLEMAIRQEKYPIAEALAKLAGTLKLKPNKGVGNEIFSELDDPIAGTIPLASAESDAKQMLDTLKGKLEAVGDDVVEPDSLSNLTTDNSIVLIDSERNIPFDCLLTQVDLSYGQFGIYSFYKMQLIKQTKGPDLVLLFTRWGRMGDTGQYQKTPFPTEAEAVTEFMKIFRSKSGNIWNDFASTPFVPQPKKYRIVTLDRSKINKVHPKFAEIVKVDFDLLERKSKSQRTDLSPSMLQLMRKLCFEHRSKSLADQQSLGEEHLAFGQIEYSKLQKAEEILDQIDKHLTEFETKRTQPVDTKPAPGESVLELSEAYFTLIPLHGYALEKIAPLSQFGDLRKHQQLIRNFLHSEFAFQLLLAAQWNLERMNPLDYVYATIGTKLETLEKSSEEAQLILEYIYNTSDRNKPFVDKIYRVQVPGGDERLKNLGIGNRHLLWHGTLTCNLISILHRGLQIAPLGYNFNGSLFGKGIYFADMFGKSSKYCRTMEADQPKFTFLCEVALGKIQDIETGYWVSQNEAILKKGNHCLKTSNSRYRPEPSADVFWKGRRIALGQQSENILPESNPNAAYGHGLDYNEYIVFNPHQANIKYLVQFHGNFPQVKMDNLFR